jgi:putative chitinase
VCSSDLLKIMPSAGEARAAQFIGPLNAAMREFAIDTPKRQAAFLAQIGHESGSLRYVQEIASGSAYDNRADLGNTKPEAIALAELAGTTPGRYYKGHGLIQITGYSNHLACSRALLNDDSVVSNPTVLERDDLACRSAAWFWDSRGLNAFADAGDFETITKKINGGLNGQADRLAYYQRARHALAEPSGGDAAASVPFPVKPSEEGKQMVPFVLAALPSLIQAAPNLIRLFGNGGEQAEKNAKAAEAVVEIAKAVTSQPTAEGAVAAIQANPEVAAEFVKGVEDQWYSLSGEAGGGGISGARDYAAKMSPPDKPWMSPALWVTIAMMPLVYLVVIIVLQGEGWSNEIRVMVVSSVLSFVLGSVSGFWLGTSFSSQRKTELLGK